MAVMTADKVRTREDFVAFTRQLAEFVPSLEEGTSNTDLERYLGALSAWTNDMETYFVNKGEAVPDQPSWSLFARILQAAVIYE